MAASRDAAAIEAQSNQWVDQMRAALRRWIFQSGRQLTALDRQLGNAGGYLSHLLQGDIQLQAAHVAALAGALGVSQRAIYQEIFPALAHESAEAATREAPGVPAASTNRAALTALVHEILGEIQGDQRRRSPTVRGVERGEQQEFPTENALLDIGNRANQRLRERLREALIVKGVKARDVAIRLGERPGWLYKRFSSQARTLPLSFCWSVLLAAEIDPATFVDRALEEVETTGEETTPKPQAADREELRALVESIVRQHLEGEKALPEPG